jgi:hypothetical protein
MELLVPITVDDESLVATNVTEDEAVWSAATTYALDAVARGNQASNQHMLYRSLAAGNLNRQPPPDATTPNAWWVYYGPTNAWKQFDGSPQSQTSFADHVENHFQVAGQMNAVAALNVEGSSCRIMMIDPTFGVVYNELISLQSTEGIDDWYAYFFEPITFLTDVVRTDLPPYAGAQVSIWVYNEGGEAKIGECIPGFAKKIGETQYGARVGIIDYSRKTQDSFGNYRVTERPWARRADFQVELSPGMVDRVVRMLADFRAKPIVYIGSTAYGASVVYGFFKQFDVEMASPSLSWCNITVEGLA